MDVVRHSGSGVAAVYDTAAHSISEQQQALPLTLFASAINRLIVSLDASGRQASHVDQQSHGSVQEWVHH